MGEQIDNEALFVVEEQEQTLLEDLAFAVVDTETTGLRAGPDRVIEIAGVLVQNGEIRDTFQSLVNPERPLPSFITGLTGITTKMVALAPPMHEVFPSFLEFIRGTVLVGHNFPFDLRFLANEASMLGYDFPTTGLDTIPLARRFLPGLTRFKLANLVDYLRLTHNSHHRALGDAHVTAEAFLHIIQRARKQGILTLDHLQKRLQLPVAWSGDITQIQVRERASAIKRKPAETPLPISPGRPTGKLFLNPAWREHFSQQPGVYLMKNEQQEILYVGKAKNLRDRLTSYYHHPLGQNRKIDKLLPQVKEIETRVTGSELEALLLESQLIKALQPPYNVLLKEYGDYPYLKLDLQQTYPRLLIAPELEADNARYFGPFRSRAIVSLAIEVVEKLFPIRNCTRQMPPEGKVSEPCLRYHMQRCPAPCQGNLEPAVYQKIIEDVIAFLGGERTDLLDLLRQKMYEAAEKLNFERATWLRDSIQAAEQVLLGQRLLVGGVEASNVLIIVPSLQAGCCELFCVRHGRLLMQTTAFNDPQALDFRLRQIYEAAQKQSQAPRLLAREEVDQVNIISQWIHRHGQSRSIISFRIAEDGEEDHYQELYSQAWSVVRRVGESEELGLGLLEEE